jgi:hypothetical protein
MKLIEFFDNENWLGGYILFEPKKYLIYLRWQLNTNKQFSEFDSLDYISISDPNFDEMANEITNALDDPEYPYGYFKKISPDKAKQRQIIKILFDNI